MARLQEELKALKVREGEAVASARELQLQLQELSDTWQVRALARRARQVARATLGAGDGPRTSPPRPTCPAAAAGRSPRGSWCWASCRTS